MKANNGLGASFEKSGTARAVVALKIRVKVQPALAAGWIDGDSGDWIFSICRLGFQKVLGRKVNRNEVIPVHALLIEDGTPYDDALKRLNQIYGRE